jgi:hypothetical protein
MLEAIINSDYQIIREKVIINRHPKAKNLKEALELETESKILGEPITLEDILYLFSVNQGNYGIRIAVQRNSYLNPKNICEILLPNTIERAEWQLTKPLHEQSPETWKGIAKVVKETESK